MTYVVCVKYFNVINYNPHLPVLQVQELITRKDPDLLDNFLDEMIAFQNDRSVDVKKCIIGFMEEAW